ncbi:MAG: SulP family inorganic anion transporter [Caldilineaceae bacterium]|nr:SulP family inorganic anion transporter [Caldilineaceae bacterium]
MTHQRSPASVQALTSGWRRYFPFLAIVRTYQTAWLRPDVLAGVTVFAVLVPSALAYGELAGLAPVAGLYAAVGAMLGYALFGSSRQAILGPDASLPLLMMAAIAPLAAGDMARYAALAATTALLAGAICVAAGFLRFGFIANFISQPILTGYMAGIALTVIGGQLGRLFGIKVQADLFFSQVLEVVQRLGETQLLTFVIGAASIALLFYGKRRWPRWPGPLLLMAATIALVTLLNLDERGVAVVGSIPSGMPQIALPRFSAGDFFALLVPSLSIALIAFTDVLVNSTSFAAKNKYRVDADQELIGLGAANIGSSLLGGFPVSSSSARTAVADSMGGRTQVVGLVAALLCVVFLLFLTGLLTNLPLVTLAAILIVAVWGLIDFAQLRWLYRVRRSEFWLAMLTAFGVLTVGLLQTILLAVVLSLLGVIARMSRPHDAVLSHDAAQDLFVEREIDPRTTDVELLPGLIVYRFDAPLFFANAPYFLDRARALIDSAEHPVRWFLINAEPIVDVDATAAAIFMEFDAEMDERHIQIAIARAGEPLRAMLDRTGVTERIGEAFFFPSLHGAIQAYEISATAAPPVSTPPAP